MNNSCNRRELIAAAVALGVSPQIAFGETGQTMNSKPIPSSGEALPLVGLGTYQVFDVVSTAAEIELRRKIVKLLTSNGGSLLDTSPMYNRSEKVIGDVIRSADNREDLFLATKVWADGKAAGTRQMLRSAELMQTDTIDLMQVHNLRDTALHMESIRDMQADGRVRYSGLTHYTAGAHNALVDGMKTHRPDFIQINYSMGERESEDKVLPTAQDLGIAVLINRPFQAGRLFGAVSGKALPGWVKPFAASWGQFFLKFILGHPAVTCVIPATSKTHHMIDNLGAGMGELPDSATRRRMADFFSSL
jgi:diketogulonate reductase-like aldo/keto reductase